MKPHLIQQARAARVLGVPIYARGRYRDRAAQIAAGADSYSLPRTYADLADDESRDESRGVCDGYHGAGYRSVVERRAAWQARGLEFHAIGHQPYRTVPTALLRAARAAEAATPAIARNLTPPDWRAAAGAPMTARPVTAGERADALMAGVPIPSGVRYASPSWVYLTEREAGPERAERAHAYRADVPSYMVRKAAARGWRPAERRAGIAPVFGSLVAMDASRWPVADDGTPLEGPPAPVRRWAMEPASDVVFAASREPMAAHPWSLALEGAGTILLHNAGHDAARPDVWSRRHRSHVTRPDRVAFRGVVRYRPPAWHRYGAVRGHAAERISDAGTVELLTTVGGPVGTGAQVRRGWYGHRAVTLSIAARRGTGGRRAVARTAQKKERAASGATSKRGRAVTPWAMSDRSLPRAVITAGAVERAAILEDVLRTSADGATVTFGDVRVTIMGAAQVVDDQHGAYPVREWCRRAALAGVDPADL